MFDPEEYGLINQLVFDTANVGICVTDKNRRFVKVNQAYCELYGYSENELLNQKFTLVLPIEQEEHASELHDLYINGKTDESAGEWIVKHKNGQLIDIWVTTGRFVDSNGDTFKVTTVTDIRPQKKYILQLQKALAIKEALLKEVHHRVKNNLNMITGLIFLQDDGGSSLVKEKLRDISNRIRSLSAVHEHLYHSDNLSAINCKDFIPDFLQEIIKSYALNQEINIHESIADITLSENTAINLGLIINELVTNSIKHGFEGTVLNKTITVKLTDQNDYIFLSVSDNGKGKDLTKKSSSALGLLVIENLVGKENILLKNTHGLQVEVKIKKDHY